MEPSYKEYIEGTAKVLHESEKENEKYEVEILGRKFIVYPNVFSPKYFFDTEFFAKELPVQKDADFLEIGPGTGAISVFAIINGAKHVTAIDINPAAVENTKENAKLNDVENKITVLQGDIYSPLSEDDKFDTIFWNTPFGYIEGEVTVLEKAVFDPEYKSTRKFIFEAKNHLKKHGRLLIGFSTTLGKFEIIEEFLNQAGFKVKCLAKTESVETHPVLFELFEAVLSE
jgi:release factor glutamine methyltransferase